MSSRSRAALVALTLLLVTAGLGSGVALAEEVPGSSPSSAAAHPVAESAVSTAAVTGPTAALGSADESNTTMVVQIEEDGDARWRVTKYFNLSSHNETEAYRDLAEQFQAGETSALGLDAFRRARDEASSFTGREMRIEEPERTAAPAATVENGTGWVRISFTWTNFAKSDGDRLVVRDAFRSREGVWIDGLSTGQTLIMHAPEGWAVVDANTSVSEATLTWRGPTELDQDRLAATFTGSGSSGSGLADALWMGLLVLVALLGLGLAVFLVRRTEGLPVPGGVPDVALDELRSNGEGSSGTSDPGPDAAGNNPAPAANGAESEAADATEGDDVDLELLSDEERVERLLEDNGGRMKQATIVKETGWSNAKVSQLLSSMDQDDRIDKLRIGRENLISFPDEDLTDVEE